MNSGKFVRVDENVYGYDHSEHEKSENESPKEVTLILDENGKIKEIIPM